MTDHITITVPGSNKKALIAGATMLLTLADKLPIVTLDDIKKPEVETKAGLHIVKEDEGTTLKEFESETDIAIDPTVDEEIPPVPGSEEIPPVPGLVSETGADTTVREATLPVDASVAANANKGTVDVQLDSTGLPWDSRIHAGTKTFLKAGAWKLKPRVDKELVKTVEQELRDLMAVPTAETTGTATVEADGDAPTTFPTFLKAVSELIAAEKTDLDKVEAVLQANGVRTMAALAARADLIPQVWTAVLNDE